MADFEDRVRAALAGGAGAAPSVDRLADGARRRLRRRRRTTAGVAVAALVAAAVPVGMVVAGDRGGTGSGDDSDVIAGQPRPDIPSDWRWEAWRDLEVAVPDSWTDGASSQWCVNPGTVGLVDRGEGFSTMVACEPTLSSSVRFHEGTLEEPLPDVQGVGERVHVAGSTVDVVAQDQATLDAIVATIRQFDVYGDSRGCPSGVYASSDFRLDPDPGGALTVCRFTRETGQHDPSYWLAESRTLTPEQSADVRDAVAAAPKGGLPFQRCEGQGEFYLLLTRERVPLWVYNGECGDHHVLRATSDEGYEKRRVTARLLELLGSPYGLLRG